ncbi:MAG: hypothetical protein KDD66_03235, partial [Bdellovibrionales bacterium]|nr:hypothetical protein [Bdellovibrionales bacterium]
QLSNTFDRIDESVSEYSKVAASIRDELGKPTRVLMHNSMLHAELLDSGIQAVPVWSPELLVLINTDTTFGEGLDVLESQRIEYVYFEGNSLNDRYLQEHPFYKQLYKSCYSEHVDSRICSLVEIRNSAIE